MGQASDSPSIDHRTSLVEGSRGRGGWRIEQVHHAFALLDAEVVEQRPGAVLRLRAHALAARPNVVAIS